MSKPLDDYLAKVGRELRHLPQSVRENELRELHSHLEQLSDDFASNGLTPEAAQTRAIGEFASPRVLGAKLTDAWEGQETGWKPIFKAFFAGLLFWMPATAFLLLAVMVFQIQAESALFPSAPILIGCLCALIPLLTGSIHAHFVGRRAWIMSAVVYIPFWCEELVARRPAESFIDGFSLSFWGWNLTWGIIGATVTAYWLRRLQMTKWILAEAGATSSTSANVKHRSGINRRSKWIFCLVLLAVPPGIGLEATRRLNHMMHPPTATDAARYKLLLSRVPMDMAPPDPITVEEIPPTAAEIASETRRVRFVAVCHVTKEYRKRRMKYLQQQLALPQGRRGWSKADVQSALHRLENNAFPVSGILKVKRTAEGWQVEQSYSDISRLWGWAQNTGFDG